MEGAPGEKGRRTPEPGVYRERGSAFEMAAVRRLADYARPDFDAAGGGAGEQTRSLDSAVKALDRIADELQRARREPLLLRIRGTDLSVKLHHWPPTNGPIPELVVKVNRWNVRVSLYVLRSGRLYRRTDGAKQLVCDCRLAPRLRRDDEPLTVLEVHKIVDRAMARIIKDNATLGERLRVRGIRMLKPLGVAVVTGAKTSVAGL